MHTSCERWMESRVRCTEWWHCDDLEWPQSSLIVPFFVSGFPSYLWNGWSWSQSLQILYAGSTYSVQCNRCGIFRHMSHVAWSVCLCVCLLVTRMCHEKTAEPTEMPLGELTQVGPRNHAFDGGLVPPKGRDNVRGCPSSPHWKALGVLAEV